MKVFLSWSGERSQALAEALKDWLPLVLHFVEPWLSKSDINAGDRWALEIAKELEANDFGIICITRENINSPWILFELGALAKSLQQGRVTPLLLNMEFSEITGPLAQFQAKKADKLGMRELITTINKISQQPVPETRLPVLYDMAWSQFEEKLKAIPDNAPTKHNRPLPEVLEELVTGTRRMELRFREAFEDGYRSKRRRYSPMMLEEIMFGSKMMGRRDPIRILILASALKDSFPWVYELGIDTYRSLTEGDSKRQKEAMQRFSTAMKVLRRGPFLEEAGMDKTSYMMVREFEHLMLEYEVRGDEPPGIEDENPRADEA